MKHPTMLAAAAGILVLAASLWGGPVPLPSAPAQEGDDAPKPEFIGADGCKKCHFKQWMSWKKTSMAKSFETLKPGVVADAKTKHGLDPAKDYTKDASCLPCHTTGYGKPGGYPALADGKGWTEEETKRAESRQGVQCESCHGPGSLSAEHKKDHPEYKREDLMKMGLILADKDACAQCHRPESPTVADDFVLDFEALCSDATKIHDHVPLKHKH